jgi:glycosyltransferase involved in cell wall biosynthesis
MKVLLILENSPAANSGIDRHCQSILNMYRGDPQVEVSYICKENIRWRRSKLIGKVVFSYRRLKKMIAASNCDVVHVHGFALYTASQGLRAALKLQKRVVYTAHYHPFSSLNRPLLGRLFFQLFIRRYLSRVDTIIAINNDDFRFFKRFNPNVIRVPNGTTGMKRYSVERKKNMILFVGRNFNNKGIAYLNHIPAAKYEVHCVTDHVKGLSGSIKVHLSVDDEQVSKLYAQASLLVVPSSYEAFSYVALEALERGAPVLMSNFVRIADHLEGISGWETFEYGNVADFLSKIDSAMAKKVDVEKVIDRFSEKSIKCKLDKIYKTSVG